MALYYPAIIEAASQGFGVFFPDLPGCTTAGATIQEAARNAKEALRAHLDITMEHHETAPLPSEVDTIVVDRDIHEVARILVRAA